MTYILGLDISTSILGICILNSSLSLGDKDYIHKFDHINFKNCKSIWEKADLVNDYFSKCNLSISGISIEEPLMGFRQGMSSAQTISMLMRFNGIVSYLSRNTFKIDPAYINSAHARKLCGIKLQKTSIAGPQKEQVFTHMKNHDLINISWDKKKNGDIVDCARDMCDAYVVARAYHISLKK